MSLSSPGQSDEESEPECRICRETTGTLLPSCRCNTVVHADCLHRWLDYRADALFPLLSSAAHDVCEICRHPIHASVRAAWQPLLPAPAAKCSALLLPRALLSQALRFCDTAFTVETCLFLFLFVLAVTGHALFVAGVYKGVSRDEHALKRVALALANAAVTLSLLVLVHKLAMRWLRDADVGAHTSSAHVPIAHDVEAQLASDRFASRCTTFSQILVGALLSVIAAAEIFLVVMQLPLGSLA